MTIQTAAPALKTNQEIAQELENCRKLGYSRLLVFNFVEVNFDYDPSNSDSIPDREHHVFRYVKPSERILDVIRREEDPQIEFTFERAYRVPGQYEKITAMNIESFVVATRSTFGM